MGAMRRFLDKGASWYVMDDLKEYEQALIDSERRRADRMLRIFVVAVAIIAFAVMFAVSLALR